jgi:hypothetical protein
VLVRIGPTLKRMRSVCWRRRRYKQFKADPSSFGVCDLIILRHALVTSTEVHDQPAGLTKCSEIPPGATNLEVGHQSFQEYRYMQCHSVLLSYADLRQPRI